MLSDESEGCSQPVAINHRGRSMEHLRLNQPRHNGLVLHLYCLAQRYRDTCYQPIEESRSIVAVVVNCTCNRMRRFDRVTASLTGAQQIARPNISVPAG